MIKQVRLSDDRYNKLVKEIERLGNCVLDKKRNHVHRREALGMLYGVSYALELLGADDDFKKALCKALGFSGISELAKHLWNDRRDS